MEQIRTIVYFTRHDPAAVIGLLLIGGAGVLFAHIFLNMVRIGYKLPNTFFGIKNLVWTLPAAYLRMCSHEKQWSPWPAYLIWPCGIVGIVLLVIGLFRLGF